MTDLVTCEHCGETVERKRTAQRYCSKPCSVSAAVARHRAKSDGESPKEVLTEGDPVGGIDRSAYSAQRPAPAVPVTPSAHGSNPDGSTPGALQGDDYQLDYYPDGFPKLPRCLDRRPSRHKLFNELMEIAA
jgi:hypothetical protein